MDSLPERSPLDAGPAARGCPRWTVFLLLWVTLLIYGGMTAPVPGVNEPHYLGKAKHFWDPAWCAGDLLYESSNAHAVFYFVTGWWAHWLSLPQLAWLGRGVGYGLFAWGWQRFHQALGLVAWQPCWSLLGFLALASGGNLSGEWIVGGIEGKVFAYGFLLLAFADWQADRSLRAVLWAGLAISIHPIAGGWGVLAGMLGGLRTRQRTWRADGISLSVLLLAALPGLLPALQLLITNDPKSVRADGTYLQVYYRLAHHLDPMKFSWRSWAGYGALLVLATGLQRNLSVHPAGRTWWRIVGWSGLFALVGLIAGWGDRPTKGLPAYLAAQPFHDARMTLLKFYPFRLFDVVVPLTVAMGMTRWVAEWFNSVVGVAERSPPHPNPLPRGGGEGTGKESSALQPKSTLLTIRIVPLLAGGLLLVAIAGGEWWRAQFHEPTVFDTPAWTDVCVWIRDHTPADALIQTPVRNQNFKWHAERAEYVSYKDVPQDNAGLVEWNRRLRFLDKWYRDHRGDGSYSNEELRALRAATQITHILTDRLGPFELPPCYTNDRFRVYDLTVLDESR